ncbi:MAG TPA: hypothetical protein VFX40_00730, partial [Gemmatimonadaceae bacterium]|nr:hypothetical protein [Gemmatimonadaceae bacterium]
MYPSMGKRLLTLLIASANADISGPAFLLKRNFPLQIGGVQGRAPVEEDPLPGPMRVYVNISIPVEQAEDQTLRSRCGFRACQ